MLLHEGLTHIHSQKKPKLHFGESFALRYVDNLRNVDINTGLHDKTSFMLHKQNICTVIYIYIYIYL